MLGLLLPANIRYRLCFGFYLYKICANYVAIIYKRLKFKVYFFQD